MSDAEGDEVGEREAESAADTSYYLNSYTESHTHCVNEKGLGSNE